jgi:hypothetical protein
MTRDISPERTLESTVAGREPVTVIPLPRSLDWRDRPPIATPQSGMPRPDARLPNPGARFPRPVRLPAGTRREPVNLGAGHYQLRGSEVETLTVVGTFRIVFARDLEHYPNARTLEADIRSLHDQQLIERGTIVLKDERAHVDVLTLTAAGKRLLESHRATPDGRAAVPADPADNVQQFYAGWVRTVDLAHDAGIYRMVTAERDRIEAAGGHLIRVVLDHELRADVQHALNQAERIALAAAHDLPVADGHVRFPDARLEYETGAGERAHVDLELVTRTYQGAHLARKVASGFTLYHLGGAPSGRSGAAPYGPVRRRSVSR